jgi:cytochrome oxidase Cu insertion factor (SCO1/SenC/PrrC family)
MTRRPTPGLRAALAVLVAASVLGAGGPWLAPARAGTPEELEDRLIDLQVFPLDDAPPPLALPGLDGKRHDLAAAKGRVVLLYFWATW